MAPPVQPRPRARFGHMRYCFKALVDRTWATEGIFNFPLISSKNLKSTGVHDGMGVEGWFN